MSDRIEIVSFIHWSNNDDNWRTSMSAFSFVLGFSLSFVVLSWCTCRRSPASERLQYRFCSTSALWRESQRSWSATTWTGGDLCPGSILFFSPHTQFFHVDKWHYRVRYWCVRVVVVRVRAVFARRTMYVGTVWMCVLWLTDYFIWMYSSGNIFNLRDDPYLGSKLLCE